MFCLHFNPLYIYESIDQILFSLMKSFSKVETCCFIVSSDYSLFVWYSAYRFSHFGVYTFHFFNRVLVFLSQILIYSHHLFFHIFGMLFPFLCHSLRSLPWTKFIFFLHNHTIFVRLQSNITQNWLSKKP